MSADDGTPEAVTHREIAEMLRTFARSNWRSMTLEIRGIRVTVGKDGPPSTAVSRPVATPLAAVPNPAPAPVATPVATTAVAAPAAAPLLDTTGLIEVRSPAVGSFWVAPSPGAPPFVVTGQVVEADEQLAIVEVMKLMNPVVAPLAGEIVQICAGNAELVEYDQVLFLLRPSDG
jgi:acetyl-CoA carboxylase biotin carboxyl carrier protein